MLEIGDLAPDFALLSDESRLVKLSELRGQRVVVFFYPKADTPGCTRQACGFRDNHATLDEAGTIVLGISPDQPDKLAEWQAKVQLPYALLSDPDHETAEAYGVWQEKTHFGNTYMGIVRSHFVIGSDGRLEDVQYKVSPEESVSAALAYVKAKE